MSAAVCFRCDWEGSTRRDACPRCGARLHREAPAGGKKRVRTSRPAAGTPGEPPAGSGAVGEDPDRASRIGSPPGPSSTPRRSSTPVRALAAMAAAAVVLGVLWTRVPPPAASGPLAAPSPTGPPASPGILVYAARALGSPGRSVLWYLDLSTGRALPGPTVPAPIELVDASLAGPGWLGVTTVGPRGNLVASIVKGTLLSELPIRIGSGDLVAWGPQGKDVAIAQQGPVRHGCHRASIEVIGLDGSDSRILDERHLCGDLLSLGRDGAFTYFTRVADGRTFISSFGLGLTRTVLPGRGLLSVSPASDFLLVAPPPSHPVHVRPVGGRAPDIVSGPARAVSYRRATGAGPPAPYRSGGRALDGDRVLAWSPDSSRAAVVGRLGTDHGIFLVNTGAGDVRRVPVLMVRGRDRLGAAFTPTGAVYLASGGHLYRYTEWLSSVVLATGGPPSGPMAWLP